MPKTTKKKQENKSALKATINVTSIETHSRSKTPPFIVAFDIYNYNVHNV
jgi:hypothetical protein